MIRRLWSFPAVRFFPTILMGRFEMIQEDGLLSVIYLAEDSDVMREETDMALLRFRTREPDFSGTTALALTNKLTGETESSSLELLPALLRARL